MSGGFVCNLNLMKINQSEFLEKRVTFAIKTIKMLVNVFFFLVGLWRKNNYFLDLQLLNMHINMMHTACQAKSDCLSFS